jgi:fermentation-respiration switch protein FrsA (DUF1100 family)
MALVLGLAGLYVAISILLWAFQERITFPAPRDPLPDPHAVLGYGERIELQMRDGTRLRGWYLPARTAKDPSAALLWFYGNGETVGAIWPVIRDFRPPGAALLVIDYPGYGASGGRATEAGVYEAGDQAYDALAKRPDVDAQRIYVYGRSLGSAVATHVAATHSVAGLILESPFTSARDMASRHYRIVPRFLVRLQLDNLARIQRLRCPILIFHGTQDMLVPIEMGRRLAAAASGPVEFVMIEGAGHNDTYDLGGRRYQEKIAGFVR